VHAPAAARAQSLTIAGLSDTYGSCSGTYAEGQGTAATFCQPTGVAVNSAGSTLCECSPGCMLILPQRPQPTPELGAQT
jgi:hypothetical protein